MNEASFWTGAVVQACGWSLLTIGLYLAVKRIYRRWGRWWQMPLALTPLLVIGVVLALHVPYRDYYHSTGWLIILLGPATVAFAVPIYEQRAMIRQYWPILGAGMLVGTATAILTSWLFASLLGIDGALRLSLLPRSISTPFAMDVSRDIGGTADLTAVFVVITGVLGSILGEFMVARLPLRSSLSRGAMLGVAAHAAGTAKAHEIGSEEGSVAGLLMILVGMLNVFGATIFAALS
ncbi:LrgB family protein [Pseudodesulfovibrio thermohalotolerans]|uniref:LrgB family protein n=1 Tax=Pseudodesulfovibrio thermohalotolerans TaxID=2880651 RepID=UPI00244281ED|nr:LrgB family protein [Pseudodesulfovibrio thermohalotolerans]WFS62329.1 LrgB family protein [Pseudodesulfovibrio thermohalotolerans]